MNQQMVSLDKNSYKSRSCVDHLMKTHDQKLEEPNPVFFPTHSVLLSFLCNFI